MGLFYRTNKKLLFLLFFTAILINTVQSQLLTPAEYNSGGQETIIDKTVYSYSIGGLAVTTFSDEDQSITQGYQQIDSIIVNAIYIDPKTHISGFPNPSKDNIEIILSNLDEPVCCYIELVSPLGLPIRLGNVYCFEDELPVEVSISHFDSGIYWINLIDKNSNRIVGTLKIIKVR
jgi:hypothetical protein